MKSLNNIKEYLNDQNFDLEHESNMVQSRILSTILKVIGNKGYTQADLKELSGISQPMLSGIFNIRRNLNMEHIARLQKALDIVLQPPKYLSKDDHYKLHYENYDYEEDTTKKIYVNPTKAKKKWKIHPIKNTSNYEHSASISKIQQNEKNHQKEDEFEFV